MSRKKLFIESLIDTDKMALEQGLRHSKSPELRARCHAVLLSFEKFEVKKLAIIFSVSEDTIRTWLNKWIKFGFDGLVPKPGRGSKPRLSINNLEQVEIVEKAVENTALKGTNMLDEVNEKLDFKKPISKWTLNRFLVKKTTVTKDFVSGRKKNLKSAKLKRS